MASIFKKAKSSRGEEIPIAQIARNPAQPRQIFDEDKLNLLSASIAENGLLQPVILRENNGEYELIAGERRLLACRMLGWKSIPAIIREVDETESAVLAIVENIHRADLNCFEEAAAIKELIEKCSLTQKEAAKKIGCSQPSIANKLRLLRFSQKLQRRLIQLNLTERHIRALLALTDEKEVLAAAELIAASQMTVTEAEKYIASFKKKRSPSTAPMRLFVIKDLRILFNTLNRAVENVKLAGINITAERCDSEKELCYLVRIPKDEAYMQKTASTDTR